MRHLLKFLGLTLILGGAYLFFWPVPVAPVAWQAPENPGYSGAFTANTRLQAARFLDLQGHEGPEDAAIGPDGLVYMTSHDGEILRSPPEGPVEVFASTNGRPLGIEFGPNGTLYVADAFNGLLAVAPDGTVQLLADKTADGSPILYANDVDIAPDGRIYFTDASTRFSAAEIGSTLKASVLDLVEHRSNARVLRYDPATGMVDVFAEGFSFANGLAIDAEGEAALVLETGAYKLWRLPLDGGERTVLLDALPGFPDNINRAPDGSFWFGLVSPRNALMDRLADKPFLRRMVMRLPERWKPAPTRYGLVIRVDSAGQVLETLQDPSGAYALTTGAVMLPDGSLAITSLTEPRLAILPPEG